MKKERPGVHVGDIWRDRDRRMWGGNRRVRVTRAVRESDGVCQVFYQQVAGQNNVASGPEYRSRYERFQRSFDLIEPPRAAGAVDPDAGGSTE